MNITSNLGKPLVVDEFDVRRPVSQRNEGLQLIYGLIQNSSDAIAGAHVYLSCAAGVMGSAITVLSVSICIASFRPSDTVAGVHVQLNLCCKYNQFCCYV